MLTWSLLLADPSSTPGGGEVENLRLPVFDDNTQEVVDQTSGEGISMVKATANSAPATPFLLGEGLPPIPAKLVAKIQKRRVCGHGGAPPR